MPPPDGYDPDAYLSTAETAKLWGTSTTYVRQLCRNGEIDGAIQIASRLGPRARLVWRIPRRVAESYAPPAPRGLS